MNGWWVYGWTNGRRDQMGSNVPRVFSLLPMYLGFIEIQWDGMDTYGAMSDCYTYV